MPLTNTTVRTDAKNFSPPLLVLILAFILAGCASNTPRENHALGTTIGAAAGAGLGAASGPSPGPVTVIGTGALVGALIGYSFGTVMQDSDKEKAFRALAEGKTATWQNPETKATYTITPAANCVNFNGNPACRRFMATQTASDGSTRKIFRTACKGSRGGWELVR